MAPCYFAAVSSGDEPAPPTRQIGAHQVSVGAFRVRVALGPDAGATAESEATELTVGTDLGNALQLTDPTVSRHHCAFTPTFAGVRVRDLQSTNGTFIAGCGVETALLAPQTTVRIGQTSLVFEPLDHLVPQPVSELESFGGMLGTSLVMRRLFSLLPRIAASDATVLIEGETGTGKSLLARMIHEASGRAPRPFVVVDCSAIPPSLIESELFGHEKGAFTGAVARRGGLFEAADGGTVFLDEIGELPLETQPVLLSVLETREVRRVGAIDSRKINVRVIAATNRDLREEVNRGIFRSDLWYRLNTLRLAIPPLRERPEDIALLVAHFYRQFASDTKAGPPLDLVERMCRHRWPGNVRELRSAVERALVFSDPALWEELGANEPLPQDPPPEDASFPVEFSPEVSFRTAKGRIVARWERAYLAELMRRNDGNISQAARTARMDRNYLRELLARHGINIR